MAHRVINIGRWVVDFLFVKERYDEEGIYACLYEIDAPYSVILRVGEIMESGKLNCGFTFSNPEMRRAVCVVGPTSSGKEFVNTLSHEIYHLSAAIANSLGKDLDGEFPAYLTGDTIEKLIEVICDFGCSKCH